MQAYSVCAEAKAGDASELVVDPSGLLEGQPVEVVNGSEGQEKFSDVVKNAVLNGKITVNIGVGIKGYKIIKADGKEIGKDRFQFDDHIQIKFVTDADALPTNNQNVCSLHWLQFARRTLLIGADKTPEKNPRSIQVGIELPTIINIFTPTTKWRIDHLNQKSPWYEDGGFFQSSGRVFSMFDSPSDGLKNDPGLQQDFKDLNVTGVHDEFNTYLVLNNKAYYVVNWESNWTLSQAGRWSRKYENITGKNLNGVGLQMLNKDYSTNANGQLEGNTWVRRGPKVFDPNGVRPEAFGPF